MLAPLIGLVARATVPTSAGAAPVNPLWAGMVLANLLVTANRAADAGVIEQAEAPDLVVRTLFDGLA